MFFLNFNYYTTKQKGLQWPKELDMVKNKKFDFFTEKRGTSMESVLRRRLGVGGSWRTRMGSQRQLSE
jgi:hypothetical protein